MEILIVGAGIGGLTLACALHRMLPEARISVAERDASLSSRAQGYGIGLRRRYGLAVLSRLGLDEELERVARPVSELRLLTTAGRTLLRARPAGPGSPEALFAVPRVELRRLLLETLPEETVSWGACAAGFADGGDRAEVRFADGSRRTADAVVACDGARSLARRELLGSALRYVGLSRIAGLAGGVEHPLVASGSFMTLGRGCSTFVQTFPGGRVGWSFTARTEQGELTGLTRVELRERVLEAVSGWHAPLPELVRSTEPESLSPRGLYDVAPPDRACSGRIVLLGDASHAMTPYRGVGANMAMVDALELSAALAARFEGGLDAALRAYEQAMLPRNRAAVRRSRAAAEALHPASRTGALARDLRLRTAGSLRRLGRR